jgi:hypothetical protein
MKSFYGQVGRRGYFEGWYLKQQTQTDTVALIPAFHVDRVGRASASLQVITDRQAFHLDFPARSFRAARNTFFVRLGNSIFSQRGCRLDVAAKDLTLRGLLRFGPFVPPAYDMMGPFCLVPKMQCRHSVWSLYHRVDGALTINGRRVLFQKGSGYMEGDRGVSFPRRYLWTHCCWDGNSMMISVADIPFYGLCFTGCTGYLFLQGREYRIATYCGARPLHVSSDSLLIQQGELTLHIRLLQGQSQALRAPQAGSMIRLIRESPSCRVRYTCRTGKRVLFDFVCGRASFESNWTQEDPPCAAGPPTFDTKR